MEKAKTALAKSKTVLHPLYNTIKGFKFWMMAFVCFLLRLFVKQPFGALLALIIGTVWVVSNVKAIQAFFSGFRDKVSTPRHGCEKESLWYEYEGKEKIDALIFQLTTENVHYCNLTQKIPDMPPLSHWYAISLELQKKGVTTQISGDTFYISWPPAEAAGE